MWIRIRDINALKTLPIGVAEEASLSMASTKFENPNAASPNNLYRLRFCAAIERSRAIHPDSDSLIIQLSWTFPKNSPANAIMPFGKKAPKCLIPWRAFSPEKNWPWSSLERLLQNPPGLQTAENVDSTRQTRSLYRLPSWANTAANSEILEKWQPSFEFD